MSSVRHIVHARSRSRSLQLISLFAASHPVYPTECLRYPGYGASARNRTMNSTQSTLNVTPMCRPYDCIAQEHSSGCTARTRSARHTHRCSLQTRRINNRTWLRTAASSAFRLLFAERTHDARERFHAFLPVAQRSIPRGCARGRPER